MITLCTPQQTDQQNAQCGKEEHEQISYIYCQIDINCILKVIELSIDVSSILNLIIQNSDFLFWSIQI